MVLHRKDAVLGALHAFGRAVEQVYVRQPEAGGGQRVDVHGIAVVLARDLDPSRLQIFHGVVPAAVAEFHLHGLGAIGQRYELVPHADAENRQFAAQLPDQPDHRRHILGVAWAVRQHDAVGMEGHDLLDRRVVGHDGHIAAHAVKLANDIVLDAAVDGHHVVLVVGNARHPAFLAAHT